jgi:hypothetical protein
MSMFWSKVFLQTVLFFSCIYFDNAAQDMRTKGGELVPDFGWFSILLNLILNLNTHYHLCTYFVF